MLTTISLENYKGFRQPQAIELRPLTVLIGRNSSGKSLVARLPLLLGRSVSGEAEGALDLEFEGLDFGASYRDLIYNQNPHGAISLGAEVRRAERQTVRFQAKVQHFDEYKLLQVVSFDLTCVSDEKHEDICVRWVGQDPLRQGSDYQIETPMRQLCTIEFRGLLPQSIHSRGAVASDSGVFQETLQAVHSACTTISAAFAHIRYLGPFRQKPERAYRFGGAAPRDVGLAGARAPELLGDDVLRRQGRLLDAVGRWYAQSFGKWRLDLSHQGDRFSLVLRHPIDADTEINLVDVGIGMAQVLPIVVQRHLEGSDNLRDAIEIVEQPELHLHPAAHGGIADLYVDAVRASPGSCHIVETHSENLVLRLRRRVAERALDPNNLIIYWVDDENPSARRLRAIHVDATGEVDDWPRGVFSEDFQEVREIRRKQQELVR